LNSSRRHGRKSRGTRGRPEFDGALLALKKNGDMAYNQGKWEAAGKRWMGTLRFITHPAANWRGYPFTRSEVRAKVDQLSAALTVMALTEYRRGMFRRRSPAGRRSFPTTPGTRRRPARWRPQRGSSRRSRRCPPGSRPGSGCAAPQGDPADPPLSLPCPSAFAHEVEDRHRHPGQEERRHLPAISEIASPWKIGSNRITEAPDDHRRRGQEHRAEPDRPASMTAWSAASLREAQLHEIHEDDRVAHDDSRPAMNPIIEVAVKNAPSARGPEGSHEGEGDRGHDRDRRAERLEPADHQDVDQTSTAANARPRSRNTS